MSSRRIVKRIFDLSITVPGFAVSIPLQACIALAVRVKLGAPVFFRQERPGLNGQPFTLIKFRTMREADQERGIITDEERMTRFGAFLRASSLDELPTLWNIVRGDMSLVGPRPLLMAYLGRYSPEQMRRHEVKPGLTGLSQVNGRNSLTWEQKFAYDLQYVDENSLRLDMKILFMTVVGVLRREGISAEGSVTMPEFFGTLSSDAYDRSSNGDC